MSIILKALKKLQEEKAREVEVPPAEVTEGEDSILTEEAIPSSLSIMENEPGLGAALGYKEDITVRPRPPSSKPQMAHQRFGFGPKSLLVVVLILGIFTTGWFASRIYLNMKVATRARESEPQTGKTATAASKAAAAESQQGHTIEPTAVTAVSPQPEPPSSVATPAGSSVAEVVDAKPLSTPPQHVTEKPSLTAGPAFQQPKEAKPKKGGRPELKINAIAWRNAEPRAIVNMQSVYEGDMIEGAKVLAIQRKSILFEYDGDVFEVRF